MTEGEDYLIVLTNGFVFVGTYMKPSGLNDVVLKDAHFVTNCGSGVDWGTFLRKGPGSGFVVNQTGNAETILNLDFRLWSAPFTHMSKIKGKTR